MGENKELKVFMLAIDKEGEIKFGGNISLNTIKQIVESLIIQEAQKIAVENFKKEDNKD